MQVFGNTEIAYLDTLDEATQREVLKKLFDSDLACVVVTKDLAIPRSLVDACSAAQLALMKTPLLSLHLHPAGHRPSSRRRSPSPPACTAC